MDCGPAALKCLLEGFGIQASYGRLREACQTDVDGTSIDTLEDVAPKLGLAVEQVMVPIDHLDLTSSQATPAIVVVSEAGAGTHFVVLWRTLAGFVEIMDPAVGRRILRRNRFLEGVFEHEVGMAASRWHAFASGAGFGAALAQRMEKLGVGAELRRRLWADALAANRFQALAILDAAVRMTADLVAVKAVQRGAGASSLLVSLIQRADGKIDEEGPIPARYWTVRWVGEAADTSVDPLIAVRGAVLLCARGRLPVPSSETLGLSKDLAAALSEPSIRPFRRALDLARRGGVSVTPALLLVLMSALGLVLEATLFRALVDVTAMLADSARRLAAMGALVGFAGLLWGLQALTASHSRAFGRRLDLQLRMATAAKLPRMADRYFRSRLLSDMADRAHTIHRLRALPELVSSALRAGCELVITAVGIVWLDPSLLALVSAGTAVIGLLPWLSYLLLREPDLKVRTHVGSLSLFHLDALMGQLAVRAHGAEQALTRAHDTRLGALVLASVALLRRAVVAETAQALLGYGVVAALLAAHLERASETGSVLLLAYWAASLPSAGGQLGLALRQLPAQRSTLLRAVEPLDAAEEGSERAALPLERRLGVAIQYRDVSVVAGGHRVLSHVNLTIHPGERVAVVGPSGAGKSSLVALLLGFLTPSQGEVRADYQPLTGGTLVDLRRTTAWLDPSVTLWNGPVVENLTYGADVVDADAVARALQLAELGSAVDGLPEGLESPVGDAGRLLSGGEGQRLRLGRALVKKDARLVLLDEPFRGLDRLARGRLLKKASQAFGDATVVCVTHDLRETQGFDRVVVVEDGRVVESGSPRILSAVSGSRYAELLAAESRADQAVWRGASFAKLHLEAGQLKRRAPSVVELVRKEEAA